MRAIKSTKADTRRILRARARGQFYARGFPTNMSSRDLSHLMLTILHGTSILKVICILPINYATAKGDMWDMGCYTRDVDTIQWRELLTNEGYAFAMLHSRLTFLVRPESTLS